MKRFQVPASIILVLVLLASSVSLVMAASLTVTKTADTNDGVCNSDCSLREAIAASSAGDTITFDTLLAGQTIHLTSSLLIDKNLTIDGSTLASHVRLSGDTNNDGNGDVAVLEIASGATVELDGLDIVKGYSSSLTPMMGGGITNHGVLTISNSLIAENGNAADGGGIYNHGILVLNDSTLEANSAIEGGAILNDLDGVLTITNTIFSSNMAIPSNGFGGTAGAIGNIGSVSITDSVFTNNQGPTGGGAIVNAFEGTTTITNSSFSNNTTAGPGGAIYQLDGILIINNSTFSNNSADLGGAISNGVNEGSSYYSMTIENSTFHENLATSYGGAINLYGGGEALVTGSVFDHNTASAAGAMVNWASLTVANATFYDNIADPFSEGAGGGIANIGTLQMTNATFSDNTGGAFLNMGEVDLRNTILANSINGLDCTNSPGATISANINNLMESGDGCDLPAVFNDPSLGPLMDNGGPTHTMAIAPGSPAIDAGDDSSCPLIDQRDIARPQGEHCDIGAYEYEPELPTPTDVPSSTPTYTPTPTSTSTSTPTPTHTPTSTPTNTPSSTPTATQTPTILTLTLNSVAASDGWVLESNETSGIGGSQNDGANTFNLGDDASNKQYRGILHFDTSGLPDNAVISSVTLKIKEQGVTGINPFTTHGSLMVDIQKPYFGTGAALVNSDFQATAGQSGIGSFNSTPVNSWYSSSLNSQAYPSVNLTGTTQFRLLFTLDDNNDLGADNAKIYSGNATAANRPVLVIEYSVP